MEFCPESKYGDREFDATDQKSQDENIPHEHPDLATSITQLEFSTQDNSIPPAFESHKFDFNTFNETEEKKANGKFGISSASEPGVVDHASSENRVNRDEESKADMALDKDEESKADMLLDKDEESKADSVFVKDEESKADSVFVKDEELKADRVLEFEESKIPKDEMNSYYCAYDEINKKVVKIESKISLGDEQSANSSSSKTTRFHFENLSKEAIRLVTKAIKYLRGELKSKVLKILYLKIHKTYYGKYFIEAERKLKTMTKVPNIKQYNKKAISTEFKCNDKNSTKNNNLEINYDNPTENENAEISEQDIFIIRYNPKRERRVNQDEGEPNKMHKLNEVTAQIQNSNAKETGQIALSQSSFYKKFIEKKKNREIFTVLIDCLLIPKKIIGECSIKVNFDMIAKNRFDYTNIKEKYKLKDLVDLGDDNENFASIEVIEQLYYTVIYKMTIVSSISEDKNDNEKHEIDSRLKTILITYSELFPPFPTIEKSKFLEFKQNKVLLMLVFIISRKIYGQDVDFIYSYIIREANEKYFPKFIFNNINYCFIVPKNFFFYYLFIDLLYNHGEVFDMFHIEMNDGWDKIDLEDKDYKNFIKFKDEDLFRDCYRNKNVKFTFNFLINQILNQDKISTIVKHLGRKKLYDKNIEELYKKTILDQSYRKKKR